MREPDPSPAAKPASFTVGQAEQKLDAAARVSTGSVRHGDALLDAQETLQTLHESGVFDFIRGLAGAQKEITGQIAAAANTPEMIAGIRNLLIVARLLAAVDSDRLEAIVTGNAGQAPGGLVKKPPGLLSLVKRASGRDSRRALAATVNVLESVGRELGARSRKQ